ncbi:molybdenum cofactor biosynthesis protein MoaA [Actibacterium mucosum KCTC 23349]|uniref:Molybdopterin molybdenumtransferase n=1 Tax=Actibacterium mucosum KCTC 23349 TaxID=1454373 RepID=A0A037ZI86_9RHOB|nr:gephyrin-like molybdotransferase Glp [Actibacterium mucosum]KAJ54520.1 molybdenum cofactor biosynthesis protein MoaA [Actibacterium mucosum KCTC 23349]
MISVAEALDRLLELVDVLPTEDVPLAQANGRALAADIVARRTQPPFDASAMDGYAVKAAEVEPAAMFRVVGEAAAGKAFDGVIKAGEAVRIFTGAPVPDGADCIVIQEDTSRSGDVITLLPELGDGTHIRPAGGDFFEGARLSAPCRLGPNDIALAAAMNVPHLTVRRKPRVALIATGNELVMPGETPGPDQIIASNSFGLQALLESAGAEVRMLPIARDTTASLRAVFDLAKGADLVITIGGASVGDHDLVAPVAAELGMQQAFYKIAMRPGKPLMAGRMGDAAMIGLPGNPVSAMVCGHVFVLPTLRAMMGLPQPDLTRQAPLAAAIGTNGPRQHYMRATLGLDGLMVFDRQDSSLLSVLGAANALVIRPPHDGARDAGEDVSYMPL